VPFVYGMFDPAPPACPAAGTYSGEGKNAGGDKACQKCPPGKFQTVTGSTACTGYLCAAGKYGPVVSTSSGGATCTNCEAAKYQATAGVIKCVCISLY